MDGVVFTLNTEAELTAFNAENGRKIWETEIHHPDEDDLVIGGGIAYSAGRLFATNGYNELIAIAPKTGDIIWRKELSAPARAAPTIVDGRVFITTLDNKLLALSAEDGSSLWEYFLVALLVMAMPMVLVGLRSLAEIDPQYTEIYLQSRKYPKIIRAVDTPFAERRFRK